MPQTLEQRIASLNANIQSARNGLLFFLRTGLGNAEVTLRAAQSAIASKEDADSQVAAGRIEGAIALIRFAQSRTEDSLTNLIAGVQSAVSGALADAAGGPQDTLIEIQASIEGKLDRNNKDLALLIGDAFELTKQTIGSQMSAIGGLLLQGQNVLQNFLTERIRSLEDTINPAITLAQNFLAELIAQIPAKTVEAFFTFLISEAPEGFAP